MPDSPRVINRREQDAIETEIARLAPSRFMAIADDDPRRCPCGGLGRLHNIRGEYDGVRRCGYCRQPEAQLVENARDAA